MAGLAPTHRAGPEATIVSRPLAATFGFPLTGAASIAVPRSCARARISAAAAGEIVVESTIKPGVASSRESSAADNLFDVGGAGDHREHDVAVGEVGRRVDERRAEPLEVEHLLPRAVVDRHRVAGLEQPHDQRPAHAADAHPPKARRFLFHQAAPPLQSIAKSDRNSSA